MGEVAVEVVDMSPPMLATHPKKRRISGEEPLLDHPPPSYPMTEAEVQSVGRCWLCDREADVLDKCGRCGCLLCGRTPSCCLVKCETCQLGICNVDECTTRRCVSCGARVCKTCFPVGQNRCRTCLDADQSQQQMEEEPPRQQEPEVDDVEIESSQSRTLLAPDAAVFTYRVPPKSRLCVDHPIVALAPSLDVCLVCKKNYVKTIFPGCGHAVLCIACSRKRFTRCPVNSCRKPVDCVVEILSATESL